MISGYPKDVVITSGPLGGCGDHSLFSTLARRFANEGHRVWAHEDNIARNEEILELWWRLNPFIERCDCSGPHERFCPCRLTPTAGYVRQGRFYDVVNTLPLGSNLEAMERAHGFGPPYSIAPDLYYKPKPTIHDLKNVTLLDMHALSSAIAPEGWAAFHQKMVDRFGPISLVSFAAHIARSIPQPPGVPTYGVGSIFEYCDMLASCRAFVGSEAGGQALAAAVRGEHDVFDLQARPEIVCLSAANTFNSRAFCFRGVDYRVSKFAAGGDYLEPVEVPYSRYHEACATSVKQKRSEYLQAKGLPDDH